MGCRVNHNFSRIASLLLLIILAATAPSQVVNSGPARAIERVANLPSYDVVSIKLNTTGGESSNINVLEGTVIATNVTLGSLIEFAYDIKQDMVSGLSGPVSAARFDLQAKVLPVDGTGPTVTGDQLQAMLIPLLADRFHLKAHIQPQTLPVYELVLVHGGPRFKTVQTDPGNGSMNYRDADSQKQLTATSSSMDDLADELANELHRKVIDKTGLTGVADFTLKWTPELEVGATENSLSIFTAVEQQLGLKLQPSKGSVDTLIIDHVEMPTQN